MDTVGGACSIGAGEPMSLSGSVVEESSAVASASVGDTLYGEGNGLEAQSGSLSGSGVRCNHDYVVYLSKLTRFTVIHRGM